MPSEPLLMLDCPSIWYFRIKLPARRAVVSTITGILLLANLWTTAAAIPQQPEDASRQINIEALSRL